MLQEVLVSLAIAGFALAAISEVFSTQTRNIDAGITSRHALELARNLLARTGVDMPLKSGVQTGSDADGFRWSLIVRPLSRTASDDALTDARNWELFAVEASAGRVGVNNGPSTVRLRTIRFGAMPR